jgi:hypothetical protein
MKVRTNLKAGEFTVTITQINIATITQNNSVTITE